MRVASTFQQMEPQPLPDIARGCYVIGPCFILNEEGAYVATGVLCLSRDRRHVFGLWWDRYKNPPTWETTPAPVPPMIGAG